MKKIRIRRDSGYYGRLRKLLIKVDDAVITSLREGEETEIEIQDSARIIHGSMDWGRTHKLDLTNIDPSEIIVFKGHFTLNFLAMMGLTSMPFRVYKEQI